MGLGNHQGAFELGIDIGSLFLKVVISQKGQITRHFYQPHLGEPIRLFRHILQRLQGEAEMAHQNFQVACCGSLGQRLADILEIPLSDQITCEVLGGRARLPGVRNIINIGGSSATIIALDEQSHFLNFSTNSLCAAGTGSFLDEQAQRLKLDYHTLASFEPTKQPPTIASRCAVFAKSDLIHRQQEGYSREDMWTGLCQGMTQTMLQTLLKGKPLHGQTFVSGGVSRNKIVMHFLRQLYGDIIITSEDGHLLGAIGAIALMLDQPPQEPFSLAQLHDIISRIDEMAPGEAQSVCRNQPLRLSKSHYPEFRQEQFEIDALGNEIRLIKNPSQPELALYLGIDIGSTSTKLVGLDQAGDVVVDIYRRTLGEPVQACQKLFQALTNLLSQQGVALRILGCGTTGSGRRMVGKLIGADVIKNEISAHVAGALSVDPSVETIFEIGGQDSKYMRLKNGHIIEANMNYVPPGRVHLSRSRPINLS
jgi:activator of 2-hydroxyglutaryl-CoA dehydratase